MPLADQSGYRCYCACPLLTNQDTGVTAHAPGWPIRLHLLLHMPLADQSGYKAVIGCQHAGWPIRIQVLLRMPLADQSGYKQLSWLPTRWLTAPGPLSLSLCGWFVVPLEPNGCTAASSLPPPPPLFSQLAQFTNTILHTHTQSHCVSPSPLRPIPKCLFVYTAKLRQFCPRGHFFSPFFLETLGYFFIIEMSSFWNFTNVLTELIQF